MYIYKIAVNVQASNLVLILKTKSRELTVYSEMKIQYLAFINVRNKTKKHILSFLVYSSAHAPFDLRFTLTTEIYNIMPHGKFEVNNVFIFLEIL